MTPRPTTPLACALLALVLLAAVLPERARAEDPKSGDLRGELTAYRFDDDLVSGDTLRPSVEVLHVRKRGERESLVRARTHYIPELLETAQNL